MKTVNRIMRVLLLGIFVLLFQSVRAEEEVTQKLNKSVVMITHDTRLLDEVDKVYEMQDGVLTQVR